MIMSVICSGCFLLFDHWHILYKDCVLISPASLHVLTRSSKGNIMQKSRRRLWEAYLESSSRLTNIRASKMVIHMDGKDNYFI